MINEKRYQLVPVVIVIVFLAATWLLTPNALTFQEAPPVGSVLAALFTISLFLERSLEVFINTWRSAGRTRVENQVKKASDGAKEEAAERLSSYKTDTQILALWTSFAFGLFISAVGIRTMQSLVTAESLNGLSSNQLNLFHVADVLLTGGLISGGSEGIHKLTQVFTDFMEASSARLKAQKLEAETPTDTPPAG